MAFFRASIGGGGGSQVAYGTFQPTGGLDDEDFCYCGFRPKYVSVVTQGSTGTESTLGRGAGRYIYDEDLSTTYCFIGYMTAQNSAAMNTVDVAHNGTTSKISEITSTGFYFRHPNNGYYRGMHYWFACG